MLTLAGIIALGCILFSFTRPQQQAAVPTGEAAKHAPRENISLFLSLKYAHKPSSLAIHLKEGAEGANDRIIFEGSPTAMTLEETISIAKESLKKSPLTLVVEAAWPEGTPDTPISITLEPDALEQRSATQWSAEGKLHNTYLFSW